MMKKSKYTQEVKLGYGVVKIKIWNQCLESHTWKEWPLNIKIHIRVLENSFWVL